MIASLPRNLHRFLISTTSRLVGEYQSPEMEITHAWHLAGPPHRIRQGVEETAYSRNYFVLSVEIDEPTKKSVVIPNYHRLGDWFCALFSLFYGKRFDNHGLLVSGGSFQVPDLDHVKPSSYFTDPPFNHKPRPDLAIPLNLSELSAIAPLFTDEQNPRFFNALNVASRFYLRSLQNIDHQPEFAYLDLVTCGEVLSNYRKYPHEELLDKDALDDLREIERHVPNGEKIAKRLRGRMRQVSRSYTLTILKLLNDRFYAAPPSGAFSRQLEAGDIDKRIRASYDLRSLYLHTGVAFGQWIQPLGLNSPELQLGRPGVESKLSDLLWLAPTFLGLERIIRYCLLRFIHLNSLRIHADLDD